MGAVILPAESLPLDLWLPLCKPHGLMGQNCGHFPLPLGIWATCSAVFSCPFHLLSQESVLFRDLVNLPHKYM